MAKNGRGLICLSMSQQRVDDLGLDLMSKDNRTRHHTAFTVSIEAREGVSTGISAHDRAHTIQTAIDPSKGAAGHCYAGPCLSAGRQGRRCVAEGWAHGSGRRYLADGGAA